MKKLLLSLSLAICLAIGATLSFSNIAKADNVYPILWIYDDAAEYEIALSTEKPAANSVITVFRPTLRDFMTKGNYNLSFTLIERDQNNKNISKLMLNEADGSLPKTNEPIRITLKNNPQMVVGGWEFLNAQGNAGGAYCGFAWYSDGSLYPENKDINGVQPLKPSKTISQSEISTSINVSTANTSTTSEKTPVATAKPESSPSHPFTPGPEGTIYRLLLPTTNKHLYSTDVNECKALTAAGWVQETSPGISATSGVGIYRLYNPATDEHLFTADTNERDTLASKNGWKIDNGGKPIFYGVESGTPVYRLYNPTVPTVASHHYTSDKNEINVLLGAKWQYDNGGNPVYYLK